MSGAIVTIGNFDGVHLGHRFVLREVVARACALGAKSFAITFDPHPQAVLHPERKLVKLADADEKVALIREQGIDDVWVCPFTRELAHMAPDQFLHLVAARQPLRELWIGHDFALGRGRSGTVTVLAEISRSRGWGLHLVPPHRTEGQAESSTLIRALLASGEVEQAARLLGRPYTVRGALERSEGGGVRIRVPADRAMPAPAEYVARLTRGEHHDSVRAAVLPAVGESADREVLVGALAPLPPASLPSRAVSLSFLTRLRPLGADPEHTPLPEPSDEDLARARAAAQGSRA